MTVRWSPPRHCCEEMNTLFDDMVSLDPLLNRKA
jgi:hypothetical protein